jgi:NitT/TauT family transport system permease protein
MKSARNLLLTVLLFCASMAGWEALVRVLEVPIFILPPPSKVAMALWRGFASGLYLTHLYYTLAETILGFLLGAALGFFLGTAVATNRYVEYFLYPYIVMFQSLPKVALAPLIIIWFGLGLTSKVVNAALIAFFPLLVNTMVGLQSADEDRVSLMRSLAASERQIFWMLRLPSALPFVMAGLDVAMIFALIGAIVAEFVGARWGLGMLIQSMNFTMDVSGQFSILIVLSVVGLILNRCILFIRRRILFWDPSEKARAEIWPAEGVEPRQGLAPAAREREGVGTW